ncbi:MAG: nucleotidyltransferase domain-containing protein [Oscillospiraceae bacterium]|nr:nucleotidyltransferase domain-containing protein [Oscillospiraceae bacterium]
MLDKKTAIENVRRYAEALKDEIAPSSVVIFGSYVNGNPGEDSDIDVGVVFNGFNGDWWQTTRLLWRLRRGISYDIEPHLLDIQNDESGFASHVLNTGQLVYQQ